MTVIKKGVTRGINLNNCPTRGGGRGGGGGGEGEGGGGGVGGGGGGGGGGGDRRLEERFSFWWEDQADRGEARGFLRDGRGMSRGGPWEDLL